VWHRKIPNQIVVCLPARPQGALHFSPAGVEGTQRVGDLISQACIRDILNSASRHIGVPRGVKAITVDITVDLARLPYYVSAGKAVECG
jgi:hypothetical protein